MKLSNILKRGLITFLTGEVLALIKRDTAFKNGIKKMSGRDKITYIFDSVFNLNKELVQDVQDQIDFQSLKSGMDQGVQRVQQEYKELKTKITQLLKNPPPELGTFIADLSRRFTHLKESEEIIKKELGDDLARDKKMQGLKKLIEDLTKKNTTKMSK